MQGVQVHHTCQQVGWDVAGVDPDKHLDLTQLGWDKCTQAMEDAIASDKAEPIFQQAADKFQEVAATGVCVSLKACLYTTLCLISAHCTCKCVLIMLHLEVASVQSRCASPVVRAWRQGLHCWPSSAPVQHAINSRYADSMLLL